MRYGRFTPYYSIILRGNTGFVIPGMVDRGDPTVWLGLCGGQVNGPVTHFRNGGIVLLHDTIGWFEFLTVKKSMFICSKPCQSKGVVDSAVGITRMARARGNPTDHDISSFTFSSRSHAMVTQSVIMISYNCIKY